MHVRSNACTALIRTLAHHHQSIVTSINVRWHQVLIANHPLLGYGRLIPGTVHRHALDPCVKNWGTAPMQPYCYHRKGEIEQKLRTKTKNVVGIVHRAEILSQDAMINLL